MQSSRDQSDVLGADLLRVVEGWLEQLKPIGGAPIGEHDDIFLRYGLDSVEALRLVVRLENHFDIDIGAEPLDFQRIKTLSGLRAVVTERLAEGR